MGSCFLFGHASCTEAILPNLAQAIEDCYSIGIHSFYVGNRGRFDSLAAAAVKRAKQEHQDIQLFLVLAYHPAERAVNLTDGFDSSFYPPLEGVPRKFAIVRANRYMIDTADIIICYVMHTGNSRNMLVYAQQRNKYVINVAEG